MRSINIIGQIDEKMCTTVISTILEMEAKDNEIIEKNKSLPKKDRIPIEDLYINITTSGGNLYLFHALADILKKMKCKVITRAYGKCYSCGFLIFLLGDERLAGPHTVLMSHPLAYGYNDNVYKHESYLNTNMNIQLELHEFVLSRTKIPKKIYNKYINTELWLHYEDALKYKIITKEF